MLCRRNEFLNRKESNMRNIMIVAALTVGTPALAQTAPAQTAPAQTAPAQTAPAQGDAPAQGAAPAQGTAAPASAPTPGAVVMGPDGQQAGTVDSVVPGGVVVNTGTNKVTLPTSAIAAGPNGLTASLGKAELDAAAVKAQADAQAQLKTALTPGAQVYGTQGAVVGTVKSADATGAVLTTTKGDVKLPMNGFTMGQSGPMIGMTAAQLEAAVTQAKAGS
jgi:hypothetical protein